MKSTQALALGCVMGVFQPQVIPIRLVPVITGLWLAVNDSVVPLALVTFPS